MNFETAPVHPMALNPERTRLLVCNLPDARLEVFDISSGTLVAVGAVPVGLDPVSVRFRNSEEAWVVNHISDSISVVHLPTLRVVATINTLTTPGDIVFAGSPQRAFVSCAMPNTIQVFDPITRQSVTNIIVDAERPKALAVSPDGNTVYAAIFESGNGTTVIGGRFRNLTFFSNAVSAASSPYGGLNPPPNSGNVFDPPLNPTLGTNVTPSSGIIVRKNLEGRWLDDNQRDWTDFVSGTNAALTQRVPGWDLPDRDIAIIDTGSYAVSYATGLMNVCMALDVNPMSGRVALVGTDAINEVRFEPNLNGVFTRVKVAMVDPSGGAATVTDLNPHLDYTVRTVSASQRDRSIGDPRAIAWTIDGRAYVAGMGSRNVVMVNGDGTRTGSGPIDVGEGPCGLALDEARQRLYVFNRFSASVSTIDTDTDSVISAVSLFDPTPLPVAAGRRHLYDTRLTSGLGQAACASCHVDARMDRLGWDLGNPAGEMTRASVNHQGVRATNDYHPMKGVMVTQTLQDIIGHEPFHWRGDKESIEAFASTFTNLQAAPIGITPAGMRDLRSFLASIRYPPNRHREFDNSLPTNVPLAGHVALGEHILPKGAPLPNGNALAGLASFNASANFCNTCHALPSGLGLDVLTQGDTLQSIPPGPDGEHHLPLAFRLEGSLRSKIAHFQNMGAKIGMDGQRTQSRAGFGFGHDGSIDTLTRFLNGVRIFPDQEVANVIAFLLSVPGSKVTSPGAAPQSGVPAAIGRQVTIASASRPALFDSMLALARSATNGVDLIAKSMLQQERRGWYYDRTRNVFQADRRSESVSVDDFIAVASPGTEITFTVVPLGSGVRLGIDRDQDGALDGDENDAGSNPADNAWVPRVIAMMTNVPLGTDLQLDAQVPPLPAPGVMMWLRDGMPIVHATNSILLVSNFNASAAGEYAIVVSTAFQSVTSAPVHIAVVPLLLTASPDTQSVRRGSNATFAASAISSAPVKYQWRFNDELLAITNAFLVISNVNLEHEGEYCVIGENVYGRETSGPVRLVVLVNPAVSVPPLSLAVAAGGTATFSFVISGNPPPFGYQLRRSSTVIITNYASMERTGFLTLPTVQPADAGTYRIVVTNAANPSPGLTLGPVTLSVLVDTDGDGMPDDWEIARGLNPSDGSDAGLDADEDSQSNAHEYLAGTDPHDAQSVLRVSRVALADGGNAALIEFQAASNTTYSVQNSDGVGHAWIGLADVVAAPTNRMFVVTNAVGAEKGFYRIVTPRSPH